jgi:hypothetical protein
MVAIRILDALEYVWLQFSYNSDLLLRKDVFDCLQLAKEPK